MFENSIRQRAQLLAEELTADCVEVTANDLGLDRRCGSVFFVCEEFLAVPKYDNKTLRYYGGFEYVDDDFITEVGDTVFYSTEDSRVHGHVAKALGGDEEFDDEAQDE